MESLSVMDPSNNDQWSSTTLLTTQRVQVNQPQTDFSNTHRLYIGIGSGAVLANLVVFAVLLSDRGYLKQSPMLIGLAGGNFLNGMGHVLVGAYRLILTVQNKHTLLITAWECALTGLQLVYLLGSHVPALMLIAVGIERLSALAAPHFYRRVWTIVRSWYLVAALYSLAVICVFGSWLAAGVVMDGVMVPRTCTTPLYVGKAYSTYLYTIPILGGSIGSTMTLSAMVVGYHRIKNLSINSDSKHRLHRQVRLTRALLSIAVSDLALVAVPNLFLFLDNAVHIPPPISSAQSSVMYCCNSMLILVSCLLLNGEFRSRAVRLFGLQRLFLTTSTIQDITPNKRSRSTTKDIQTSVFHAPKH